MLSMELHDTKHQILRMGEKKIKSSPLFFQFEILKLAEISDTSVYASFPSLLNTDSRAFSSARL